MFKSWIKSKVKEYVESAKQEAVDRVTETFSGDVLKSAVDKELERQVADLVRANISREAQRVMANVKDYKAASYYNMIYGFSDVNAGVECSRPYIEMLRTVLAEECGDRVVDEIRRHIEGVTSRKAMQALDQKVQDPEFLKSLIKFINQFQVMNTGGIPGPHKESTHD